MFQNHTRTEQPPYSTLGFLPGTPIWSMVSLTMSVSVSCLPRIFYVKGHFEKFLCQNCDRFDTVMKCINKVGQAVRAIFMSTIRITVLAKGKILNLSEMNLYFTGKLNQYCYPELCVRGWIAVQIYALKNGFVTSPWSKRKTTSEVSQAAIAIFMSPKKLTFFKHVHVNMT